MLRLNFNGEYAFVFTLHFRGFKLGGFSFSKLIGTSEIIDSFSVININTDIS